MDPQGNAVPDPTFPTPIERIVAVPLKSYITVTWAYHVGL